MTTENPAPQALDPASPMSVGQALDALSSLSVADLEGRLKALDAERDVLKALLSMAKARTRVSKPRKRNGKVLPHNPQE